MDQIIQSVKDVFATMTVLGWLPIPMAVSIIAMLSGRIAFEPDVLDVNTKEALSVMGKRKLYIFFGVSSITLLMQFGLQKPTNGFDRALCIGFSLADTMFAYVLSSSNKVKGLIKSKFQGDNNAPTSSL